MLYLIYGGDSASRLAKIEELRKELASIYPGALETDLNTEEINEDKLDELSFGQGLFQNVSVVILRNTLETKELKELFGNKIKILASSLNVFIIGEPRTTKDIIERVEKNGGKAIFLGLEEKGLKKDNSGFALADAVARRDRKGAWALFVEAVSKGARAEELHGIIFWQFKNLLLVKNGGLAEKLSYPLMKAKSFAPKWDERELKTALSRLISIYHESHRGTVEFPIALEKFLLEVV
ncbi:MAG: hypothetical protein AAB471_01945 [Patescibacteria group bacterium]